MAEAFSIIVQPAGRPALPERQVEMCEHKGIGHPDTLTDAICEAAARDLARNYRRAFGRVLHFNVDKGLLIAGRSEPRFGGGRILQCPDLIVCGRAANPEGKLDLADIVTRAARDYLRDKLRADTRDFAIRPRVQDGSRSLQQIYESSGDIARANDTSFGVGFAPFSALEEMVLRLGATLRSTEFRNVFPAAGDDFKVMGLREGRRFDFTVAVAMVDRYVTGVRNYFETKQAMQQYLVARLNGDSNVVINALDDPNAEDESSLYLTVSGLSAEMGDDGQVGRGNRVNGLITPGRAMSLEAVAGKNPVAHVGKIYNVLAQRVASAIQEHVPGVVETTVQLLSRIGQPIDRPRIIVIDLLAAGALTYAMRARATRVAEQHVSRLHRLIDELSEKNS